MKRFNMTREKSNEMCLDLFYKLPADISLEAARATVFLAVEFIAEQLSKEPKAEEEEEAKNEDS